ncbi:MAG: hypothetical protein DDT42_01672 [candidate division WS2 bacterium]|uniref:Uncharacterized protein n=1 Tax=Psychracetigena formicireducens TaxID=2986056 RepID=A0A9E2BJT8_PSYF1|nr:hypothetical protein [Candidatus Psychracetigena formicireducens]
MNFKIVYGVVGDVRDKDRDVTDEELGYDIDIDEDGTDKEEDDDEDTDGYCPTDC